MSEYRYPDYNSNPSISATVHQCGEEITWESNYTIVNRSFIGPDSDILKMGNENRIGNNYDCGNGLSGRISECKTTKIQSDRSKIDIQIKCKLSSESEIGDNDDPNIIDTTWNLTMSQMEVPLYRYCKPNFSVADVEKWGDAAALNWWEHTDDVKMKGQYQYKLEDSDTPQDLSGRTRDIAELINSGVEARICFYPQVSLVTHCLEVSKFKKIREKMSAVNTIETPPNLSGVISAGDYSWLKSTFDFQQNQDSTWDVTETWIGSPKYLGGWSEQLYGLSAWEMWKDN